MQEHNKCSFMQNFLPTFLFEFAIFHFRQSYALVELFYTLKTHTFNPILLYFLIIRQFLWLCIQKQLWIFVTYHERVLKSNFAGYEVHKKMKNIWTFLYFKYHLSKINYCKLIMEVGIIFKHLIIIIKSLLKKKTNYYRKQCNHSHLK